jgi:tetratricopeptide (TPR) repeat protein
VNRIFYIIIYLIFLISNLYAQEGNGTTFTYKNFSDYKNKRAIIIGVSEYQNDIPQLSYADEDAKLFRNFLISPVGASFDSSNVVLLLNQKATSRFIFEELDKLYYKTGEDDLVLIYFSGHGDYEKKAVTSTGFLLCTDALRQTYRGGGCIEIDALRKYSVDMTSKKSKVILIIDACHSGLVGEETGIINTNAALEIGWGDGISKILSSQKSETSKENNVWCGGGGVFTCYLVKGLCGEADEDNDQKISYLELQKYLWNTVPNETNKAQTPKVISDNVQEVILKINKNYGDSFLNDLSKRLIPKKPNNKTKGINDNPYKSIDTTTKKYINYFMVCLNNKNLVEPAGKCAYDVYNYLAKNKKAESVIFDLKGKLVASLQDQSYNIIKKYLDSKELPSGYSIELSVKEMYKVLDLLGTNHILYNDIKSRTLFLDAVSKKRKSVGEAIMLLNESLNYITDAAYVYNELGAIYGDSYNAKEYFDFNKAKEYFDKAIECSPAWIYPYINLGNLYIFSNILDGKKIGIEYINKVIEKSNKHYASYYNRGLSYYYMSDYENAKKDFDESIRLNPKYDKAYYLRAEMNYYQNKFEEALNDIEHVIKINPNFMIDRRINLWTLDDTKNKSSLNHLSFSSNNSNIYSFRGIINFQLYKYDEMVRDFDYVLKIDPKNPYSYYDRGMANYYNNNIKNAINDFYTAIKLDPNFSDAYYNLGIAFYKSGNYKQAINSFSYYLKLKPDSYDGYSYRATVYTDAHDNKKALEDYAKCIEIDPSRSGAYDDRVDLYIEMNNFDAAVKDIDVLISLNPKENVYWIKRGNVNVLAKNYKVAKSDYSKSLEIYPNDPKAYSKRGDVNVLLEDYYSAIDDFSEAIHFDGYNADLFMKRGDLNLKLKNNEAAIKDYSEIIFLTPEDYRGYEKRAMIYYQTSNFESAIQDFTSLISVRPEYAIAYAYRGYSYYYLFNYSKALDDFESAIVIDPNIKNKINKIYEEVKKKTK